MKIISIQNYQQKNSFKAKKNNYITKKLLEPRKISKASVEKPVNLEKLILTSSTPILGLGLLLKDLGISYCEPTENIINIGGYKNGDFYQIKTVSNLKTPQAQEFIFRSLTGSPDMLGGFVNYQAMINDIGRQDIIKKGLKLHTYELNNNVSKDEQNIATKNLIKFTKLPIKQNELFYIDSEAFYYDQNTKTVYGTNLIPQSKLYKIHPTLRTCEFITNSNGKATGYKTRDWDWYNRGYKESEYKEQQEPSTKLSPFLDIKNNKEFAESFRFGNIEKDSKLELQIPTVLKHLEEKANLLNVTQKDLQLVKYNNDGHIERKIAYYNPATGHSLVYDQEGKFAYQLDYNKDAFGKIVACTKL